MDILWLGNKRFPVVIHVRDYACQKDELEDEHHLRLVNCFCELLFIYLEFLDVVLVEAHDRVVKIAMRQLNGLFMFIMAIVDCLDFCKLFQLFLFLL